MPINNLIAHGIQPVGQDVPNILQAIGQRQRQNALLQMQQEQHGMQKDQHARDNERTKQEAYLKLAAIARRILDHKLPPDQQRAAAKRAMEVFGDTFAATGAQPKGSIDDLSDTDLTAALTSMAALAPGSNDPLEQIVGENGVPQFVERRNAVGKQPYHRPMRDYGIGPLEPVLDDNGNPVLLPREDAAGRTPYRVRGGAGSQGFKFTSGDASRFSRDAAQAYGGIYDPQTGQFAGLDKETAKKAARLAAKAAHLYRTRAGGLTHNEAFDEALNGPSTNAPPRQPPGYVPGPIGPVTPARQDDLPVIGGQRSHGPVFPSAPVPGAVGAENRGRPAAPRRAPPEAIELLRRNPQLREQFRAKYGYLPDGY